MPTASQSTFLSLSRDNLNSRDHFTGTHHQPGSLTVNAFNQNHQSEQEVSQLPKPIAHMPESGEATVSAQLIHEEGCREHFCRLEGRESIKLGGQPVPGHIRSWLAQPCLLIPPRCWELPLQSVTPGRQEQDKGARKQLAAHPAQLPAHAHCSSSREESTRSGVSLSAREDRTFCRHPC